MCAVAPGHTAAPVALTHSLSLSLLYFDDDRGQPGLLTTVGTIAIGQIRGMTARAVRLLARGLVHDDGLYPMLGFGHNDSFLLASRSKWQTGPWR